MNIYNVFCVFQVTHNQLNVLDLSMLEEGSTIAQEDLETLSHNMALSLRQLIDQRDKGSEVLGLTFAATQSIGINSQVFCVEEENLKCVKTITFCNSNMRSKPDFFLKNTCLVQVILDLTQERDYLASQQSQEGSRNLSMTSLNRGQSCDDVEMSNGGSSLVVTGLTKEEKQHLAVELADTKAKLRRYRQEV